MTILGVRGATYAARLLGNGWLIHNKRCFMHDLVMSVVGLMLVSEWMLRKGYSVAAKEARFFPFW